MPNSRRRTDRKSPVQPARARALPYVAAIALALLAAWSLRDTWVDPLEPPYPTTGADAPDAAPDTAAPGEPGAQRARGSLARLFSGDDYPVDALNRNEQGTTTVELRIDENGRVSGCSVQESSGSRSLDAATCKVLRQRARFTPATDDAGRPVPDSYTQRITWRLEG